MNLQRRDFLKIVGGATVATALPGCTPKKPQSLIPYVIPHEEIIPGKAAWYASVCRECPAGCGIRVRVREGRAVKVEGNPLHPVNQGTLCARGQASLHGLYNPDRIQHPLRKKADGTWEQISWEEAEEAIVAEIEKLIKAGKGNSIAWLTPSLTGSADALVDDFLSVVGSQRRVSYEPFSYEALKEANRQTFGRPVIPSYDFAAAQMIVSFGADFLETWLSPVGQTREYSTARSFNGESVRQAIYIGPRLSMTAANTDQWIAPIPGTEHVLALGILSLILESGKSSIPRSEAADLLRSIRDFSLPRTSELTGVRQDVIQALAESLIAAKPSLVLAGGAPIGGDGELQTCLAVNLLNYALGNIGKTVHVDTQSSLSDANSYADFSRFILSMERGEINVLFSTEVNPVFNTPPGLNVTHALSKVPLTVALSSYIDETTAQANIVLPVHTPLESWGDHEPQAGVRGLMQPVMQPVFSTTRMLGDIVIALKEKIGKKSTFSSAEQPFYEYLRNRWRLVHRQIAPRQEFDLWWTEALANGGVFDTGRRSSSPVRLSTRSFSFSAPQSSGGDFSLITYPSLAFFDGRGANRPWLQELPDPMTQITWGNWVEIHPDDAKKLDVERGDVVELISDHGTIELPAYVYHGIRPGAVAVPIGQGHTEYGRYAKGNGANVISLLHPLPLERSGSLQWSGGKVRIVKREKNVALANVAGSDYLHGRNIVQVVTVEELLRQTKELANAEHSKVEKKESPSLYPPHEHPDHRWGMAIDLDKCTGCSACVTACYAENNVPVVGKHQVELGRELTWIRVERYFDDLPPDPYEPYSPKAEFMPMMCQQCDNAPCEPVCPVYASYHTPEGLNAQVYNRCIGTRYCANNCPYKVRRFNWFDYEFPEPLNWQLNPDVTVRTKGVMEKCTFCVQRVVEAKTNAKVEGRPVRDGEITTACQQSCPAQAIEFGDLKDPHSRVNKIRDAQRVRGYRVLEELNTQPAVVYLKEIRS